MPDDKSKSKWNEVADEDATDLNLSKSLLRKIAQMNPAIKGDKNTEELMSAVKATMKQGPAPAKPSGPSLSGLRNRYRAEMQTCAEEQRKLDERRARVRTQVVEQVVAHFASTDPSLSSADTQRILREEESFFADLTLTPDKLRELLKKR